MTDIFISYASVDRPAARRLAEDLEGYGWSVWWDHRSLRGGQHFDRVIEQAILAARAVIVVWSQHSINSDWVRAEAALALDEKKLVPLRIDNTALPLRFRNIHTLDFSSWTGQTDAEPFERLLESLGDDLGRPRSSEQPEQPDRRAGPRSQAQPANIGAGAIPPAVRKHGGKTLIAILATAGVLLGVVVWGGRDEQSSPEPPPEVPVAQPPVSAGDVAAIEASYMFGDYATALSFARPAADQGNAKAQFYLGLMYADGRGVDKDDAEAVRWYRKAAKRGHARAQNNLGVMYESGLGVAKDEAEAVHWYRTAAEQGDAEAQFNLGMMYANGRGVAKDEAEAVRWYRRAADQGDDDAQFNLGVMYELGRGVAKDEAEAARWYGQASVQLNADASFNLGVMYEDGRGVAKDEAEAVRWYREAAEWGHAHAQSNLDRLSAREQR